MNRTERAIKRQLKAVQNNARKKKHSAINQLVESYGFVKSGPSTSEILKEEKNLKKWHRQIMAGAKEGIYPYNGKLVSVENSCTEGATI